ncbi:MAG: hypothetical protein OXE49_08160 [Gemmatimonadetes bacterium]|nr:hypothetical protein [Gemmatimonadota bacterium]
MQLERLLLHLKLDGWCVVEDVIPADQIEHVRQSVEAAVAEHRNPAAPSGIGHLPGIINFDQSFAPFLADENLLALVGAMLGHHPRISFTTGTINYPGNERGGWHADWAFNQNNRGHIPRPDHVPGHRAGRRAGRWAFNQQQGGHLPGAVSRRDGPLDHLVDAGPFYRRKRRHPPRPRQPPIPEQPHRRQWR